MLQVVQPLWLFVLAGISIPVIIHLWNQRPGRILKVGSIALVPEEAREYQRSLKLSDLLLLLLRCLLIAALALVLAEPFFKKTKTRGSEKGWILLTQHDFKPVYRHFKTKIDSLTNAGFELHYFKEGFPKEKLETAITKPADSIASQTPSYWQLAASLDAVNRNTFPIYIFTDNYLRHFTGNRPVLSFKPDWLTYALSPDQPAATTRLKDTRTITVLIFTDNYSNDARYVKAAVDGIAAYSKRKIDITVLQNSNQVRGQRDWLFWLSDQPMMNSDAKNIFTYVSGKPKAVSSIIKLNGNTAASFPRLYKTISANDSIRSVAEKLWTDGFGNTLLSKQQKSNQTLYRFYSHFDPSWNELAWDHNFPAIISDLLQRRQPVPTSVEDNRLIDQQQLLPAFASRQVAKTNQVPTELINLSAIVWILVFILFLAERLLSFYITKLKTNG